MRLNPGGQKMTVKKEVAIHRYVGLSTDSKPSGNTVPIGSTFYEYDTNDTYLTPDNTNWILKDSKSVRKFTVTKTLSASAAYVSGDVLSESPSAGTTWDFASVAAYNGGSGRIVQIQAETNALACSADLKLYLFTTSSPGCNVNDNLGNGAPAHSDVSSGVYLGSIDLGTLAVLGSGDAIVQLNEENTDSDLPFYFNTPSTADDLHAVMVTATAATFASKSLTLSFWVRRS